MPFCMSERLVAVFVGRFFVPFCTLTTAVPLVARCGSCELNQLTAATVKELFADASKLKD